MSEENTRKANSVYPIVILTFMSMAIPIIIRSVNTRFPFRKKVKNKIFTIIKAIVSLSLIVYLLSRVEFEQVAKIVASADVVYLSIGLILSFLAFLLLVYRWGVLLEIFLPRQKFTTLLNYYWAGQFLGLFLPGTLGGDAFRIYKVAKKYGQAVEVTMVSLIDRAIGLCSLVLLATGAIVFNLLRSNLKIPTCFIYFIFIFWVMFMLFILGFVMLLKSPYLRHVFKHYFKLGTVFIKPFASIKLFQSHKRNLGKAFGISLFAIFIAGASYYFIANAVNIDVSPLYFFLIFFMVALIVTIPISINGLGLQDGAYIYLLGQTGISTAAALSVSLTIHFIRYFIYMFGGILFLFNKE